ncbi:MAG TPA: lipid-binding protein, partial [Puia sp.]
PFPASDRDLVVHLKITQDSATKILNISAINIPDYIPPKKGIVRVPVSNESWKVIPINNNSLRIEYYLEIDPGGSIPAWLLNNFAEKGPYESFRHLQEQVDNPKYKNASVSFIRN